MRGGAWAAAGGARPSEAGAARGTAVLTDTGVDEAVAAEVANEGTSCHSNSSGGVATQCTAAV